MNRRNCRNLLILFTGVYWINAYWLCDAPVFYVVIVEIYRKLESHSCFWCIPVINTFDSPTHIGQTIIFG